MTDEMKEEKKCCGRCGEGENGSEEEGKCGSCEGGKCENCSDKTADTTKE